MTKNTTALVTAQEKAACSFHNGLVDYPGISLMKEFINLFRHSTLRIQYIVSDTAILAEFSQVSIQPLLEFN